MPEVESLLLLIRASDCQSPICDRLISWFGSTARAIRDFNADEHGPSLGLRQQTARTLQQRLRDRRLKAMVDADLAWLAMPGHHFVHRNTPAFPDLLRNLPDPPLALFCSGRLGLLGRPGLAIVGSRYPTHYGRRVAAQLAGGLARLGLMITSGMALGIDGAAHQASLAAGGDTLAVLGTGPDMIYPAQHGVLYQQIQQQGLLVSEFPPGTPAAPAHFPQRNRIVTGLSLGTLVVEARLKSGSLISARLAMEQGREVFAVPGSVLSKNSAGCHQLLRDGAKLTASLQDIVDELPLALQRAPVLLATEGLGTLPQRLIERLDGEAQSVERLAEALNLPAADILAALGILEIRGLVQFRGGGYRLTEPST